MKRDVATRQAVWKGLTLRELIAAAMVDRPDAPLFTTIGIDGRSIAFTPRTLDHMATRIARRFATAGAKPGDAIIIALPNSVHALLATLGALGAGLRPCLAPPTLDDAAIGALLHNVKPRALVSASDERFDPLSRFVMEARRMAMPLYIWNFGPQDHDHAAPLGDVLEGSAPQRLLPLHPPFAGDGPILTLTDRGNGPEPVAHRQDALIAQALLARMAAGDAPPPRIVSAVAMTSQAGLVLGPVRALLTGIPLTLIADPSASALRDAAQSGPAEWVLPPSLAKRLQQSDLAAQNGTVVSLYRAGHHAHDLVERHAFMAFGEALTLPLNRRGKALSPGVIGTATADGALHFATLGLAADGTLSIDSPLAGQFADGTIACPSLVAGVAPDGRFARFINTPAEKRHA